jgi:hypothetical protein
LEKACKDTGEILAGKVVKGLFFGFIPEASKLISC